jgi:hypothetical protein
MSAYLRTAKPGSTRFLGRRTALMLREFVHLGGRMIASPILRPVLAAALLFALTGTAHAACTIWDAAPTSALPTDASGQQLTFVASSGCEGLLVSVGDWSTTPVMGRSLGMAHLYRVSLTMADWQLLVSPQDTTFSWTITGWTRTGDVSHVTTTNELDYDGDGWTRNEGDVGRCDHDAALNPRNTDCDGPDPVSPQTYIHFDELMAPPSSGANVLPWSDKLQIETDTSIAIQFKVRIDTAPSSGECILQHGVSNPGRWVVGIGTTGAAFFGYQFRAGTVFSVFGSGVNASGDLTDGLDHTVTITRDPDGNWASYVDDDTAYATVTNTTAFSFTTETRMFDDEVNTCHWTSGTLDAVRVWNGGDYPIPSALDVDDAFFTFVATPGY